MSHNSPHDVHVEDADEDHWSEEVKDVGEQEESSPVEILHS